MIGFRAGGTWLGGSVLALVLATGSSTAQATPVTLEIDSANNYSLIHGGANPAGDGETQHYLRFASDASLDLDLDETTLILTLFGNDPQRFDLVSTDGHSSAVLDVTSFMAQLSTSVPGNGLSGNGSLGYELTTTRDIGDVKAGVTTVGNFLFEDRYFGGPFNSASLKDGDLKLALWGGDKVGGIGIDVVGSGTVSEPSMPILLSLGLVGFAVTRRRRRT